MRAFVVVRFVPGFLCVLVAAGCATSSTGGSASGPALFPSRAELLAAAQAPGPPPTPADVHFDELDTFELAGPLPERVGDAPMSASDPLGRAVLSWVAPEQTSENLACAARELGRLLVEGKRPDPRLRAFLVARCGSAAIGVSIEWLSFDRSREVTDAALLERVTAQLRDTVTGMTKQALVVGVAFARSADKDRTTFVTLADDLSARADAGSQIADAAGSYSFSGTAPKDVQWVSASVTHGLLDAAACTRDLSLELPRFRFTCPIAAGDDSARVDVFGLQRGRFLGTTVLRVMPVRSAGAASRYQKAVYASATPAPADDHALAAAFLDATNAVRATAKLSPLVASPAQSDVVGKVAPAYFARSLADDEAAGRDTIALGLLAGWDVHEIVIGDGDFSSFIDYAGGGVDDMLGSALDAPDSRRALLDPDAHVAAIAPHRIDAETIGFVFVSYAPFRPARDADKQLFEQMKAKRIAKGYHGLGEIPVEELMAEAQQRLAAGEDTATVGREVLQRCVSKMNRSLYLWSFETTDLTHIEFPEELLSPKMTYVSVAVASRKRPGDAWGSHAVLIFAFIDDNQLALR